MIYTKLTKKALRISFDAHKNQLDKGGLPYVFHPYEVASQQQSEYAVCVALLHDVVEDTDTTLSQLAEQFPQQVIDALQLLTHRDGVDYLDYVRAIKSNPLATAVKVADLHNNSDLTRLDEITDNDLQRKEKYHQALEILTQNDTDK